MEKQLKRLQEFLAGIKLATNIKGKIAIKELS